MAMVKQRYRRFQEATHAAREHTACPACIEPSSQIRELCRAVHKTRLAPCRVRSLRGGVIYNVGHRCRFITSLFILRSLWPRCLWSVFLFSRTFVPFRSVLFLWPVPSYFVSPHSFFPATRLYVARNVHEMFLLPALTRWPAPTFFVPRFHASAPSNIFLIVPWNSTYIPVDIEAISWNVVYESQLSERRGRRYRRRRKDPLIWKKLANGVTFVQLLQNHENRRKVTPFPNCLVIRDLFNVVNEPVKRTLLSNGREHSLNWKE